MRAWGRGLGLAAAVLTFLTLGSSLTAAAPAAAKPDDFMPLTKLAPFVVSGKQLSISIHARSDKDRHYAEQFAEETVKVFCDAVNNDPGRGLVIIGAKGEPHPTLVFRKFLELAKQGKLDPAVAARAPELTLTLDQWMHAVDAGKSEHKSDDSAEDFEAEQILAALPIPLEGLGAKLYRLAWSEKFDQAKVEARLIALRPADLEGAQFIHFDWVFYLPPRNEFDRVLDQLINDALKKDDVGFFARTTVKGVLLLVRPKIRAAIEGIRHGLLFMTLTEARTSYRGDDLSQLTDAYISALFDDGKRGESDHDRIVKAVRARAERLRAQASETPSPTPTATPEVTASPQ